MGWAFDGCFVAFSRHRRRRFDFADIWVLMESCVVFRVDSAMISLSLAAFACIQKRGAINTPT